MSSMPVNIILSKRPFFNKYEVLPYWLKCKTRVLQQLLHMNGAIKISFHFQSLVTFVNKHLNKVNLEVSDLDTQFHDGVYLTLLMGLLEGFFVPLYSFHLTPQDFDQKVHNVNFAFDLMQDVGLAKPKARPEGKL
jgi:hypothetical protein